MKTFLNIALLLLTLACTGCATTYVPVSWGFGSKVQDLSHQDVTLVILFNRYDPDRKTLRVSGTSFDQVMMPSEVKSHLGAYRPDTQLIYRNLYHDYGDTELRDLMVHEFAHHIWFTYMSADQRQQWRAHLRRNPSPLQAMVRMVYPPQADWDAEDFAFTVQSARPIDVMALAALKVIAPEERDQILRTRFPNLAPNLPEQTAAQEEPAK
ncbi:hypothetical protein [Geomesophilobacter sediminis]|uniref:Uncharacterized protein n=1 Tax=Geomesophilobacter sediminis TaxID=2798584 RepID=A0A8J7M0G3_9BACT|nr:hypothetical protein [Geomesophilobacter sediminis]MBJ6725037.1 hypothetical protein [Geomesophilobacter sediminis]